MTAKDYPVSFRYAATDPPYSRKHHHKGIDLATPKGSRLVIESQTVAYTGNTGSFMGQAYSPHLHIQAGRDEWAQQDIDPRPYMFKPGPIVKVGWANQWGNYMAVRVGDVNVFYCHLDTTVAKVGDVIKQEGTYMLNDKAQMDRMFWQYRHRMPSAGEYTRYLTKITISDMEKMLASGAEYNETQADLELGAKARKDKYTKRIVDAQTAVLNAAKALGYNDIGFKNKIKRI